MDEMPTGVFHSANIFKAEDWINPLNGYAYDSFNKDVLLKANAENGKMMFPNGTAYSVVIFPNEKKYSKETTSKIEELKKQGVIVLDLPYWNASTLSPIGCSPDIEIPNNIAWSHRKGENTDIYFLSNQENSFKTFGTSFRISKGAPELWNPVNGKISIPARCQENNGRVNISLSLKPYESVFVVFGNPAPLGEATQLEHQDIICTNNIKFSTWKVSFPKVNQILTSDTLFDWSKSDNNAIKYYSGTAIYTSSFIFNESAFQTTKLSLGKVCNLATVKVNGVDCGTAWTAPYEVDITKALIKGENTLEIEVTNTWANAVNGSDKGTPPFDGIWSNGKYRLKENKLLEAGLIGPVNIIQK